MVALLLLFSSAPVLADFDVDGDILTTGSVGIGVSDPSTRLEVIGSHISGVGLASFKGDSNYGFISIDNSDATATGETGILLKAGGAKKVQIGYRNSDNVFYINDGNGSNGFVVDPTTGSVGIGAHITATGNSGAFVLNAGPDGSGSGWNGFWFRTTDVAGDSDNYTNLVRITGDGRVGIGTIEPDVELDVVGTIRSNATIEEIDLDPRNVVTKNYVDTKLQDVQPSIVVKTASSEIANTQYGRALVTCDPGYIAIAGGWNYTGTINIPNCNSFHLTDPRFVVRNRPEGENGESWRIVSQCFTFTAHVTCAKM